MRKICKVLGVLGFAAIVVAAAMPASANCNPAKLAGTFGDAAGNYIYIDQGNGDWSTIRGEFWDTDLPTAKSDPVNYPASTWTFVDLGGLISMQANLGDIGVAGCPSGQLATYLAMNSPDGVRFITMLINETPAGTPGEIEFDYSAYGASKAMVVQPRPRVASSSRAGSTVNLTLNFDGVGGGIIGPDGNPTTTAMTGFQLMTFEGPADPGRNAALWTPGAVFASTGGAVSAAAASVTCSGGAGTPNDVFIATRLVFAGDVGSSSVSASTRIECDPNLADPTGFKIIDKKPKPGIGPKR